MLPKAGVEPLVVKHRPQDVERVEVQLALRIDAPDPLVTGEDVVELPYPALCFANVEVQQLVQEGSQHPRCRAQLPERRRVTAGDCRMVDGDRAAYQTVQWVHQDQPDRVRTRFRLEWQLEFHLTSHQLSAPDPEHVGQHVDDDGPAGQLGCYQGGARGRIDGLWNP